MFVKYNVFIYIFWYLQIRNTLMEFDTDLNSKTEFLWSHGLISDSTYDLFTRVCNYSTIRRQMIYENLSDVCANITKLVFTELSDYIDEYDVILDVYLSSANQQSYVLNQKVSLFWDFFSFLTVVLLFIFFYLPWSMM